MGEMDHKTSHETSLGGQMAVLRDEKAKFGKDLLNANQTKKELENRLEEKNQLIEEMQAKMDSKQKESSTSSLKWQKELQDANNKITDLTKKCKSLTEELM